ADQPLSEGCPPRCAESGVRQGHQAGREGGIVRRVLPAYQGPLLGCRWTDRGGASLGGCNGPGSGGLSMAAISVAYLLFVFIAAMAGRALYPRIEQLWLRGKKKPLPMPEYANCVEETYARLIGLYMETAEVEMQMAGLMEGVPEQYEDKILL